MLSILEKLCDASARIERVIFIAGALGAGDVMSDDLNEYFDDEDQEDIAKCLGDIPDWVDLDARGYERGEYVVEWLRDSKKLGFLVKFATPVMEPTGKNSRMFSWGYYNTQWIYADTLDDAVAKGLSWVEQRRAAEEAKTKKKKGRA